MSCHGKHGGSEYIPRSVCSKSCPVQNYLGFTSYFTFSSLQFVKFASFCNI